jgi:hypothetical protein
MRGEKKRSGPVRPGPHTILGLPGLPGDILRERRTFKMIDIATIIPIIIIVVEVCRHSRDLT